MIETAGLLKSTKFITRKERDEDETIEINMAVLTLEVPLDNLTGDGLRFLALRQNQAVSIALGLTYQPLKEEKGEQVTLTEEFQKADQPECGLDAELARIAKKEAQEFALVEHVMDRDGVAHEEAVQHIEEMADTLQEPEEAEDALPELAVVGKIVKHKQGQAIYKITRVGGNSVELTNLQSGMMSNTGLHAFEKFYIEAQEPVLTQV